MSNNESRAELARIVGSLKANVLWNSEMGRPMPFVPYGRFTPAPSLEKEGEAPVPVAAGSIADLREVRSALGDCRRCPLASLRKNLVFGEGNPRAELVFVGEAPGSDEDREGRPFVGRAGQLLTKIINAMGLAREDVYICNILKCRPPGNRNPEPGEIEMCEPFLVQQLRAIAPRFICALGTFASKTLLKKDVAITTLRGRFHTYEGIQVMPTFHPAYLLRNPAAKKLVWEDMQMVMRELSKGKA